MESKGSKEKGPMEQKEGHHTCVCRLIGILLSTGSKRELVNKVQRGCTLTLKHLYQGNTERRRYGR